MSRYQFIKQVAATEPVQVLCRVLAVSAAGYYQWLDRAARSTPDWEPAATAAFFRHAQRYGTRRLQAELQAEGHAAPNTRSSSGKERWVNIGVGVESHKRKVPAPESADYSSAAAS